MSTVKPLDQLVDSEKTAIKCSTEIQGWIKILESEKLIKDQKEAFEALESLGENPKTIIQLFHTIAQNRTKALGAALEEEEQASSLGYYHY